MIEIQHSTTHSTSTLVPTTLVTTTSVIYTKHAHQLHHVTLQVNFKEVKKPAMHVFNKLNHHVHVLKDSMPVLGDVKNVNLDPSITEDQITSTTSITTTTLEDNTKHVLQLQHVTEQDNYKEVQKHAMHVFKDQKFNVDVPKGSIKIKMFGHAKNVPLDGEETQSQTNVFRLHHVTLQANFKEVQKLAMNVFNKLNHHVHVLKDSMLLSGDVKNVNSDQSITEDPITSTTSTTTITSVTIRHAHQLHHVTLQANFKEVQKLAMPANNKLNHHVDALKDSTPIFGNVKSVN